MLIYGLIIVLIIMVKKANKINLQFRKLKAFLF